MTLRKSQWNVLRGKAWWKWWSSSSSVLTAAALVRASRGGLCECSSLLAMGTACLSLPLPLLLLFLPLFLSLPLSIPSSHENPLINPCACGTVLTSLAQHCHSPVRCSLNVDLHSLTPMWWALLLKGHDDFGNNWRSWKYYIHVFLPNSSRAFFFFFLYWEIPERMGK